MRTLTKIVATDGHRLSAYFSRPKGVAKGAIIIVQEIFGLTEQLCELADQYAAAGYSCIVPALFDRITDDNVIAYDQAEKGLALVKQCDEQHILSDIQGAMNVLEEDNISIIGFCWGGGIAYLAASELQLQSGIAYYGTRLTSYLPRTPQCPFQFHFVESDTHTPIDVIRQMQQANPDAECYIYKNATHGFANHHKLSFDLNATELAKQRAFSLIQGSSVTK
ncbi:dienelactone hydrolase family protein [Paraglaciecola arctica]|uniref:dienelactone hydrolase family protein n=1 Tax=Paraglaciecola arctica TaxID=1128911 RepID=UPI001C070543|nr:dienelactone hydrolase family protein [Paraglaciecola arctica]MBU3002956.1 dienelactone hydrolase family protein [Paraglaciecola arctica]